MGRRKTNHVYEYFVLFDDKKAECQICKKILMSQHGSNLLKHLKIHHDVVYTSVILLNEQDAVRVTKGTPVKRAERKRRRKSSNSSWSKSDSDVVKQGNNDETEETEEHETIKSSEISSYFELNEGRRATCLICDIVTESGYEDLKEHLMKHHPNIMLKIAQDQSDDEDTNNDTEAFTEVVYLEQDPVQISRPKAPEKKSTPYKIISKIDRSNLKRKRNDSENRETENPEFDAFINYITCLLKKLPKEVFAKVQMDIINDIMNATDKYSTCNNINISLVTFNNASNSGIDNPVTLSNHQQNDVSAENIQNKQEN